MATTRRPTNLSAARLRDAIAASAITIVSGIALLPTGAQAEVITAQPVTPQVVRPHVLTPPPAASPAPEPAAPPARSEPVAPSEPVEDAPPASIAAPAKSPAPAPRSSDIQIPNRGRLPLGLVECTFHCGERRKAEALVYVIAVVEHMYYTVQHPVSSLPNVSPPPEPPAIATAAQSVEDMLKDAVAGVSTLLGELLFAKN